MAVDDVLPKGVTWLGLVMGASACLVLVGGLQKSDWGSVGLALVILVLVGDGVILRRRLAESESSK